MTLHSSDYRMRVKEMENEAKSAISSFQSEHDSVVDAPLDLDDLSSAPFPRRLIESIRDSDLDSAEKQKLICYLIGSWYIDHSEGRWRTSPCQSSPQPLSPVWNRRGNGRSYVERRRGS